MTLENFLTHHGYSSLADFEEVTGCTASLYYNFSILEIEGIDPFVRSYFRGSRLSKFTDTVELKKRIKYAQAASRKFLFLKEKALEITKKYLQDTFEIGEGIIQDTDIVFTSGKRFEFLGWNFAFTGTAIDSSYTIEDGYYIRHWKSAYIICENVRKFKLERGDSKH